MSTPTQPDSTLDDLHNALQDALVEGLRGENSDKYLKHSLDFLQYRNFTPDTVSGTQGEGKQKLSDLLKTIEDDD